MRSSRRTSPRSSAPRSSACGARRPTIPATSRSTTRSSPAWSTPTAASATRCASCSPTPATSTSRTTRCRPSRCCEIDRWMLARAAQFQAEVLAHYEAFEFHPVVAKLQVFCSEDLGAFYLDVLKDRLYTTAPKSLARRSAQTALWHLTHALLRWMAPFLSFTAEEAWKLFAPGASSSIFTETYWALLRARRGAAREVGRASARCATPSTRRSRRCASAGRSARRCRPRSRIAAPPDEHALLALARRRPASSSSSRRRPTAARRRGAGGGGKRLGGDEVRALLALARRRRQRCRASDDLRALHEQPVRRGRSAQRRVTSTSHPQSRAWPWLGLALRRHRARPVHQDAGLDAFALGDSRYGDARSSTSCAYTTPARRSRSWPAHRDGSAGSSSASASSRRRSSSGCCGATAARRCSAWRSR